MKILIAYGTANGCSRSVAERIQQRFVAANLGDITVQPVEKDKSKDAARDFDILIIGSSIHMQRWLKKSQHFISNNAAALNANPKPTWAFSVGMPPPGSERIEEGQIEAWLKKNIPIRGHRLFQGSWQRETNGWCMNFFFQCFGGKYEDRRDWNAMDQWADEIVHDLRVDSQNEGPLGQ